MTDLASPICGKETAVGAKHHRSIWQHFGEITLKSADKTHQHSSVFHILHTRWLSRPLNNQSLKAKMLKLFHQICILCQHFLIDFDSFFSESYLQFYHGNGLTKM